MPSADRPLVSVIIPHYNDPRRLSLCLDSLVGQSLAADSFEILVVDNNSPCGLALVENTIAGRAQLLTQGCQGAGPARNRGVAAAKGEVLAFIDADCVASPQWLQEGLVGLAQFDIVGGAVNVSVRDENDMRGAEAFERVFAFDFKTYIQRKGFCGAGNLFCRNSVFTGVGPFRATVSEDVEWSRRATSKGYSLGYHAPAAISHPAREDWPQLRRKWERINRETFALTREGAAGVVRWLARSWVLPASILPHSVRMIFSPKLPNARARLRGIATLFHLRLWRFVDAHRLVLLNRRHDS